MKKSGFICLLGILCLFSSDGHAQDTALVNMILGMDSLICLWDFSEPGDQDRVSRGPYEYSLIEGPGRQDITRHDSGPLSGYSADFGNSGNWFYIERDDCPALDLHGEDEVTVMTWMYRTVKNKAGGGGWDSDIQAVAGIWDETNSNRQYCLFIDLRIWDSQDQVCGHITATGGPSDHYEWCMEASIGLNPIPLGEWVTVGFTYDGDSARSYLEGELDRRIDYVGGQGAWVGDEFLQRETYSRNPYYYPHGLHDGGPDGGDFTVGGVTRSGSYGNYFSGRLGGLAIFNRALSDAEMLQLTYPDSEFVDIRTGEPVKKKNQAQDLEAVYAHYQNALAVTLPPSVNGTAAVSVYNISGRRIYNQNTTEKSLTIPLKKSLSPQLLIVDVKSAGHSFRKRVLAGIPQ